MIGHYGTISASSSPIWMCGMANAQVMNRTETGICRCGQPLPELTCW
jgi:hypothetical protein